MRVLGIDTSSSMGSVAVVLAGATPWLADPIAAASARVSNAHGESLLPMLDATLRAARLTLADIDLIAVGIGPGSFTGTRIGVATAKGLALGAGKPLRGVDAFHALAADAGVASADEVEVLIDARKGEVYLARVRVDEGDLVTIGGPHHAPPGAALDRLGAQCANVAVGDGVALVTELTERSLPVRRRVDASTPSAIAIAAIAGARHLRVPVDELVLLEPLYVRPPDITLPRGTPGLPRRGA